MKVLEFGRRKSEEPRGKRNASSRSRRGYGRNPVESEGQKTSINKAGVEVPRPEPGSREPEEPDRVGKALEDLQSTTCGVPILLHER